MVKPLYAVTARASLRWQPKYFTPNQFKVWFAGAQLQHFENLQEFSLPANPISLRPKTASLLFCMRYERRSFQQDW